MRFLPSAVRRLLATLALALPLAADAATTRASLVLDSSTARPGQTVWAAVRFELAPDWHIYWRNPGTTGIATELEWTALPPGIRPDPIHWPVPARRVTTIAGTDEISYDYEHEVLLLIPLSLPDGLTPGPHEFKAKASWLECKTDGACVPGSAEISATLNIGSDPLPSSAAPSIEEWRSRLPQPAKDGVQALWDGPPNQEERPLIIEWKTDLKVAGPDFFPYEMEGASVHPAGQVLSAEDGVIRLRRKVTKTGDTWPTNLAGILLPNLEAKTPVQAFEVSVPISTPAQFAAASSTPTGKSASPDAASSAPAETKSLPLMLFYAFLGGLILNIMPCVLPVIALKILGFVNQAKEEPKRVFQMGLIYGAGVVFSFLVLAALILGLKQAGQAAGWGFQFANPKFLVGMTVLVTLVALNLFGLFEVTLTGGAMNAAGGLAAKEGPLGAFFQGMLATALATPCTAPFLAPALGFAFAQPAAIVMLMFVTIALGLAFPYVLLSWQPAWLKFLPKPGVWMQQFKIVMGFPMLATAVWLFWLTNKHYGRDGVLWIGIFLVVLALAAWVWGEFVQRGSRHRGAGMAVSLLLLGAGYGYALEKELDWRTPRQAPDAAKGSSNELQPPLTADGKKVNWQPWSLAMIERARDAGRPVLVDFTAEWCLTCNANKKTSIEIPATRQKLQALNVVPLTGDHTLQPPEILGELKKFGRAGVPLVLVYPADKSRPPIVLPEILTPGIVADALDQAVK